VTEPPLVPVRLTLEQFTDATNAARSRWEENRDAGRDDHAIRSDSWGINLQGCVTEKAVSVWTGLPWTGRFLVGDEFRAHQRRGGPDVGDDVEVRAQSFPEEGVWVRQKTRPEFRQVNTFWPGGFVVLLAGWLWVRDARRDEYWRTGVPMPNWYYPRRLLRPMSG
jgi:hypothetical protein